MNPANKPATIEIHGGIFDSRIPPELLSVINPERLSTKFTK